MIAELRRTPLWRSSQRFNKAKFAFWAFSEVQLPIYGVLRSSLIQLRRASRHLLPSTGERCAIWLMRGGSSGVIVGSRWVGCISVAFTILPVLGSSASLIELGACWLITYRPRPFSLPLFTGVRGIGFLGSSP